MPEEMMFMSFVGKRPAFAPFCGKPEPDTKVRGLPDPPGDRWETGPKAGGEPHRGGAAASSAETRRHGRRTEPRSFPATFPASTRRREKARTG